MQLGSLKPNILPLSWVSGKEKAARSTHDEEEKQLNLRVILDLLGIKERNVVRGSHDER